MVEENDREYIKKYGEECYKELLKESIEKQREEREEKKREENDYIKIEKILEEYKEKVGKIKKAKKQKEVNRKEFGLLLGAPSGIEGDWNMKNLSLRKGIDQKEIREGFQKTYGIVGKKSLMNYLKENLERGMEGDYEDL